MVAPDFFLELIQILGMLAVQAQKSLGQLGFRGPAQVGGALQAIAIALGHSPFNFGQLLAHFFRHLLETGVPMGEMGFQALDEYGEIREVGPVSAGDVGFQSCLERRQRWLC